MRNLSRDLCRPSGMAHERQALGGSAATWIIEDRAAPPWHAWHAYSAAEKALAEHRSFHGLKPFIPSPWRLADPSSRMGPSPSASPIPVRFESSQLSNALYNFSCALQFSGARRRRARGGGRPAPRRTRGCACRLGAELEGRHALPGVQEPWGATLPGDAAETGSSAGVNRILRVIHNPDDRGSWAPTRPPDFSWSCHWRCEGAFKVSEQCPPRSGAMRPLSGT